MRHAAVIDIGKTNAKVVLVDLKSLEEIAVERMPNQVLSGPPWPHYDTDALWGFILNALSKLHRVASVDAISVTTHGASAALLGEDGSLAAPVLDYEFGGPDMLSSEYDAVRPDFAETGSPRLPMGLNLGAQLFWQFNTFPELKSRVATILTYPQYWSYRLTGIARNEMTSLGCHTDFWDPNTGDFSSLVKGQGWEELMAPVAKADERLGTILNNVAAETGLPPETPVYCGIHDSNASLYAHLVGRKAPFAVVSTGTWVVSMAIGGSAGHLDPARDTLINVNAFGDPVPSARFMGGREFEVMMNGLPSKCNAGELKRVLQGPIMLLPSVEPHSGPFQGRKHRWAANGQVLSPGERFAAVSCYLALMTATGLDVIGATGPVLVEGPFANNSIYLDMLAAGTQRPVSAVAGTGTSAGAAHLVLEGKSKHKPAITSVKNHAPDWVLYANSWYQQVNR